MDDIYLDRDGAVARLVLNRPDKLNAVTEAMWQAIPHLVSQANDDANVKVLVITGTDSRAFAAGADISEFERIYASEDSAARFAKAVAQANAALAASVKPVIARIQGPCVGGGCGLALCADIRISDTSARFGITPARLGLVYSLSETKRLVDIVGPSKAKSILFTGRLLPAEEALRIGLADQVTQPDGLDAAVEDMAAQICSASQYSIRKMKLIINRIVDGQTAEDDISRQMRLEAFASEDFQEGYRAFLEKRKPDFPYR